MTNTYQKLVDILMDTLPEKHPWKGLVYSLVETLIDKGVTVQEWIPVSVDLPAIREKVLVYGSHGGIYTAYLVQGKPFPEWHKVGGKNSYCNPTHWMHRPKPPKRKRS